MIEEKKYRNNLHPHLLQAQYDLVLLLSELVGCPGNESYGTSSAGPTTSLHILIAKDKGPWHMAFGTFVLSNDAPELVFELLTKMAKFASLSCYSIIFFRNC